MLGQLPDIATELGVGGIFALLLIKEVLSYRKKGSNGDSYVKICKIGTQVEQLTDLHKQSDADGRPLVFRPPGLDKAISALNHSVNRMTTMVEKQTDLLERLRAAAEAKK